MSRTELIPIPGAGSIPTSQKGAANGIATLDGSSKLTASQLPALRLVSVSSVANQAARLALPADDDAQFVVQNDTAVTYMLAGGADPSVNGNWLVLPQPSTAGLAPIASPTFTGTTTAPEFTPSGLTGATAASRYVGATTGGPPTTGTFAVGDVVNDQAGAMWVCVSAGTPGHWVQSGRLEDFLLNGSQPYRQTFDRRVTNTNSVPAGGNGVMALSAVILYPGDVVAHLSFMSGSTGLTMGSNNDGHLWAALYNPSRNLMSQSADLGGSATWPLKQWKPFDLAAAQTITTLGIYYIAIMLHTGTGGSPVANTLYGITGGSGIIFGSGAAGQPAGQAMLGATGGSALGATAPAGPVSLTSSGQIVYAVTS